jgi:hypothetical protein
MLLSAAQSKRLDDFLIVWTESRSFFASESADLVEQSKPSIGDFRWVRKLPKIIDGSLGGRRPGVDAGSTVVIRQSGWGLSSSDCIEGTMRIPILH